MESDDFILTFRWDCEDEKFISGSVGINHKKNEFKILDDQTGRPTCITIYKLDEETCKEIVELNLQPVGT